MESATEWRGARKEPVNFKTEPRNDSSEQQRENPLQRVTDRAWGPLEH